MAFEPKTWQNGEDGGTPITASELNRIEAGVQDAHNMEVAAPSWGEVTGKPLTFSPAEHQHTTSDVTGLADALEAKADASTVTGLTGRVTTLENANPIFTPEEVDALKALLETEE